MYLQAMEDHRLHLISLNIDLIKGDCCDIKVYFGD